MCAAVDRLAANFFIFIFIVQCVRGLCGRIVAMANHSANIRTVETSKPIFVEKAFAAAVHPNYRSIRCSECYANRVSYPCPKECGQVVYCNEQCSSDDAPWHQFECEAYRGFTKVGYETVVETHIRLIARVLARLMVDGGHTSLSIGLPSYVKERHFDDLLSHYEEMKKNELTYAHVKFLSAGFRKFFASTSLSTVPMEKIQRILCTCYINTFVLSDGDLSLGISLYVNTSRFNHSCIPKAEARFNGSVIEIHAMPGTNPDEYNTEKRFDQLTIDYGTSVTASYGCWVTTARQRVESLKRRYYFRCVCQACADSIASVIEERAALVECRSCRRPYIWTKHCTKMKPACRCPESSPIQATWKQWRMATSLEKKWKRVMEDEALQKPSDKAIGSFQSVLLIAEKCWHPKMNVRLAQLIERLVQAFSGPSAKELTAEEKDRRKGYIKTLQEWYAQFTPT